MIERETLTGMRELVGELEAKLHEAGIASARAEAEWLVADTLGASRTDLYLWDGPITPAQVAQLEERLARRLAGEPLQYLLGQESFCGHRLAVNPSVLIPRPETEALAEQAVAVLRRMVRQGRQAPHVLDVGTGSGNLAIALAHAVETCAVVAVEVSWRALQTARTNVSTHGLGGRVHLVQGDWTSAIGPPACAPPVSFGEAKRGGAGRFDLIVSNPPYVPTDAVATLPQEVRQEPWQSLDGGPDGMRFHRILFRDAPRLLARGGAVCVECAELQAPVLEAFVRTQAWVSRMWIFDDLVGRPRGLCVERT